MKYPNRYISELTKRTPWIVLEQGKIFIMGRSIPENPGDFYRPVQDWVSEYIKHFNGTTRIDLGFEYINTSSLKWIYTILREISGMNESLHNANVKWYYERGDDDMSELGFILRSLVDCPFVIVEVEEMNSNRYEEINACND